MKNICLLVLVCALLWNESALGRVIQGDHGSTVVGHLYLIDSTTGHSQRLNRRHVVAPEERIQRLQLILDSLDKVLDMELKGGSVWDSTSNALVRNKEDIQQISESVRSDCYYSGRLTNETGYASFSFCFGVSGIIHTENGNYYVAALDDGISQSVTSNDTDADIPSVSVKITSSDDTKSDQQDYSEVEDIEPFDTEEEENIADESEYANVTGLPGAEEDVDSTAIKTIDISDTTPATDDISDTTPATDDVSDTTSATDAASAKKTVESATTKARRRKATVEVGVYINADYTRSLNRRGISTIAKITDWVINRWNIIRQVYTDTARVGMEVDIKLKRLEIWQNNPRYYTAPDKAHNIRSHLKIFCKESPEDKLDHKMMYTMEKALHIVGLAYVGGVCKKNQKCSIVVPTKYGVQRDLHEFGHNLGLRHDTKIKSCKWPYGFMGWQNSTMFKDCYKPTFLATMAKPSSRCLYSDSGVQTQVFSFKDNKLVNADKSISNTLGN